MVWKEGKGRGRRPSSEVGTRSSWLGFPLIYTINKIEFFLYMAKKCVLFYIIIFTFNTPGKP